MDGRHRLLGRNWWARTQDAGPRDAEGHGPGLNKAGPGIVARGPWDRRAWCSAASAAARGLGGVGAASATLVLRLGAGVGVVVGGPAVAGRAAGAGGTTMTGNVGMTRLNLVIMLHLDLLKKQIGTGSYEGMRRVLGRDHRLDVAILAVQPTEEVEDLARLRDGLSDVAQAISEELEAGAVVRDAEVALVEAAELGLQVDGALEFMVAEEALDVRPKGERGGARLVDDVEDVLVDGGV